MKIKQLPAAFMLLAISALFIGLIFGILISIQYLSPEFLKEVLPFQRMRELHVVSVVSWVVLAATAGVYAYIQEDGLTPLHRPGLAKTHLYLFAITGAGILISIGTGHMGGREYLTFYPWLMLPILSGWLMMAWNYFKTARKSPLKWPVYKWMWMTGLIFMSYHLTESNLWIIPYFREQFILDFTIQWKSYGSFVGSWNMLVYGTAIYLMSKIKGNTEMAYSKTAFFFYLLGFTNLVLGWAHHIYPVPGAAWIRGVAYTISMTEWIILIHMIYVWAKKSEQHERDRHPIAFKLLILTDVWVFVNVLIALLISIPAINLFTHGTHITVAHSMGTTIGINTTILMASLFYALKQWCQFDWQPYQLKIKSGLIIFNSSLVVFLTALIIAGYYKGLWQKGLTEYSFNQHFEALTPVYFLFLIAGLGIFTGLSFIILPLVKPLWKTSFYESGGHQPNPNTKTPKL